VEILVAARELLREQGAEHLTSREVAGRAAVAVGTVFLHFPTTAALFEALLDEQLAEALPRAIATVKARALVPRLCHVARCLFESYDVEPALSRMYLANTLFAADGAASDPRLAELGAWVTGEVQRAMERGAIEAVEPQLAFFCFFSLYFTLLVGGLKGQFGRDEQLSLLEAGLERIFL
jgi:AcrR family transcriptional regulator